MDYLQQVYYYIIPLEFLQMYYTRMYLFLLCRTFYVLKKHVAYSLNIFPNALLLGNSQSLLRLSFIPIANTAVNFQINIFFRIPTLLTLKKGNPALRPLNIPWFFIFDLLSEKAPGGAAR